MSAKTDAAVPPARKPAPTRAQALAAAEAVAAHRAVIDAGTSWLERLPDAQDLLGTLRWLAQRLPTDRDRHDDTRADVRQALLTSREEGPHVGRGGSAALRGHQPDRELPGRGDVDLRVGGGARVCRSPPVLYLPARWTGDPARCAAAGIPAQVRFATKPEQAVELLGEAIDPQVPFGWVAADGGCGQYATVRHWCQDRSLRSVVAVPCDLTLVDVTGGTVRPDHLLTAVKPHCWERRSCEEAAKGQRFYGWAGLTVRVKDEDPAAGFAHTLLICRSISDPSEVAYFLPRPRPPPHADAGDGGCRRDALEDRGEQRAGKGPARAGPVPGADLDRVAPLRQRLHVRPRVPGRAEGPAGQRPPWT